MITITRQKNTKILSPLDTIEFLTRLKSQSLSHIVKHFKISLRAGHYQVKKHKAYSDEQIDEAVRKIEREIALEVKRVPQRDYEKEEQCNHNFCTLFIKCPFCTLVLGENELDRAIDILVKKKEALAFKNKVTEIKL